MHEVAQRPQRLVDVGVRLGAVDLVEVDPIGLQPPQRVLDLGDDPAPRVAAAVGSVAHREMHLGREHDVVAAPPQRPADDLLGLTGRIDIGGVDEVDARVERAVDDADALVVIRVAPGTEHHRAEAQLGDRNAGAPQHALLHQWLLFVVGRGTRPAGRCPSSRALTGSPVGRRTPRR
jgi:hypothetical protein